MKKITFKKEPNNVVAYRESGRVSDKHLPDKGATAREMESALHWAYELGRRDRHWETEHFLKGRAVEPILEHL